MNAYIKSVAVPKEHGGWGFIVESVLVGLCLAFSVEGILLSILFTVLFLLSQPLKIFIQDYIARRHLPRTKLARDISLFYLFISIILFFGVLQMNQSPFWVPLFICLGLSLFQFISSVTTKERNLIAEILGASAIALVSAAILIAGGKDILFSFTVWSLLALRIVTSVIYVRNRLDKIKGRRFSKLSVTGTQILGFITVLIIVWVNRFSWVIVLGFIVLGIRAVYGIFKGKSVRPQKIGVAEIMYGLMNSICIIFGI